MSNSVELGERINNAIHNSPYNAREVAEAIGVTPQAISKAIRSSSMGKDNLRKMAAFTGVKQEWLISGKELAEDELDVELMTECIEAFRKVVKEMKMDNVDDAEITRLALRLYKANR